MPELILTPVDVMAGKTQALTAQSIGTTDPNSLQDGSYADEVAAMTRSARSPVSIAAGLGAGWAGYHYSRRLTMLPKGAMTRQVTLASLGVASALIGHATTSWALYSLAPRPGLSGLLEFGSITQTVVSAAAIVGIYGGIRYAYALHGKKAKRGLADKGSTTTNTYEVELWVVKKPVPPKIIDVPGGADDGYYHSIVTGTPTEILKAARALLKKSGVLGVAIIHNGEDVAYLPKGKAIEYHTVNFEPNITLRRKLQAVSGTKKTPVRRGLSDCTPKLPTVAP